MVCSAIGALCTTTSLAAVASGPPPDRATGGRAHDCTPEARIGPRLTAIRYTIWCGVEIGRVKYSIHLADGVPLLGFAKAVKAKGSGADGPFRCRLRNEVVRCVGRKIGPLTIRGSVAVPAADRCAKPVTVGGPYDIFQALPMGCRRSGPERPPRYREVMGFRREFGLDPDLRGHPARLRARILQLVRAWRRGNPVARWGMDSIGEPLRGRDQRELDYRGRYIDHNAGALERWVPRHASATYAGYDVDHEHGGIFYIGFVGNQRAQIRAFEHQAGAIATERIRPFPVPPAHSERELGRLENQLIQDGALRKLMNGVGLDILANKVEVTTEHVARVKKLLRQRYGPDAPFEVVFGRPAELL